MDKIEINIETLRKTLNEKLVVSGWDKMLTPYTNGLSFDHIMNTLVDNVNDGKRFTPRFKDVFNAFYECPYDKVKVVIVGQDPYPQLGVADGIAFSCSRKGKTEKSLQYIFKALYDGEYEGHDNDLRRWANQGVLLLNTAFTCQVNKIGSHYAIWKSFTEYLFENLNRHKTGTIFILMGRKAEQWQVLLPSQIIYKVAHPASAAYRGGRWEHLGVFNKVNDMLKKQKKTPIDW